MKPIYVKLNHRWLYSLYCHALNVMEVFLLVNFECVENSGRTGAKTNEVVKLAIEQVILSLSAFISALWNFFFISSIHHTSLWSMKINSTWIKMSPGSLRWRHTILWYCFASYGELLNYLDGWFLNLLL